MLKASVNLNAASLVAKQWIHISCIDCSNPPGAKTTIIN